MSPLMAAMLRLLRAIAWRAAVARAMALLLLVAATAPGDPAYAVSFGAKSPAATNELDERQLDPTLPVGAVHHCVQCPCHSTARLEVGPAAAPFSLARYAYAVAGYEHPRSLSPTPTPPPPRA